MRFIEEIEIEEWCAERGIDPAALSENAEALRREYFGQAVDPRGREHRVALAAFDCLGDWDECLLWMTQWGIWGSSEDWPKYYAARGALGERRSLEKAPGHLFTSSERTELKQFLLLTLENAWDARVLNARNGTSNSRRVVVSHDEYVEILASPGPPSNSRLQPT